MRSGASRTPLWWVALAVAASGCGSRPSATDAIAPQPRSPASATAPRTAAAADGRPRSGSPLADIVAALAPSHRGAPAEARRLLEQARQTATAAERPLIGRAQVILDETVALEPLIAAAGAHGGSDAELHPRLDRLLRLYGELLREWAALSRTDAKTQVTVAATLYSLPDLAESLGVPDPTRDAAWRSDGRARIDAARLGFPDYARAHAACGYICSREGEDELGCIRHYARCMTLAPDDPECRRQLADLSGQYTAPRCETSDLAAGLSIRLGTSRARPATRMVTVGSEKLHVDAKPAFTRADIAVVRSTTIRSSTREWDDKTKAFTAPVESEEAAIYFELRQDRRSAFFAWRADAVLDGGAAFLVLMDGGTLLHAARLSRRPLRSPMVISGLPITAICTRTRRATLPPDVTVPR